MTENIYPNNIGINSQIQANKSKTYWIMILFSIFIATLAFIWGKATGFGPSWALSAFFISGLMSMGSYYYGDKMVLSMSNALPADRKKESVFYEVCEKIAGIAELPMPKLYIIEDNASNAFATGRDPNHASVCATRGILNKLSRRELEGVIAHEMSHIKNYDIRLMVIVSILVGMVAFLSNWFMRSLWFGGGRRSNEEKDGLGSIMMIIGIFFALLSPIIATLIQLAVSRRREFLADGSGALITNNPQSLALALEKIAGDKEVLQSATNATAHLYIVNPVHGKNIGIWLAGLFNTHPPIEERIAILRSM